jgi:hypothetical protein
MKMERKIRAFGMIIPLKQRCMVRETPVSGEKRTLVIPIR